MGLGSRSLASTSEASRRLGSRKLGTEGKGLGLGPRALGVSVKNKQFGVMSSEFVVNNNLK